jgi:release factor glutamine methyltransferase
MKTRTLSRGEALSLLVEQFAQLAHVVSPEEHAAFTLEVVAGLKHEEIVLEPRATLSPEAAARLDKVVAATRGGLPLAYALGEWYFAGRTFYVDESVLIPRPDTETLCRVALEFCRSRPGRLRILEVGVGSGACIVSLGLELAQRQAELVGTDVSPDALYVARVNAARYRVKLQLRQGSLLDPLPANSHFNLILSNPPYVTDKDEADESVRRYEPLEAYRVPAGQPGTYFHRLLAENAGAYLSPGGMLALEVGYNQADEVKRLLTENGFSEITSAPDLAGVQRVVSGLWTE